MASQSVPSPEVAAASAKQALELVMTHGFYRGEAPLRRLIESLTHRFSATAMILLAHWGLQLDALHLAARVQRQAELAEQRGDRKRALDLYHDEETMRHELQDFFWWVKRVRFQTKPYSLRFHRPPTPVPQVVRKRVVYKGR